MSRVGDRSARLSQLMECFLLIDSRRAAFRINGVTYSSKLVDLPCIVESQKTNDNRHLFKVADISQVSLRSVIDAEPLSARCWLWINR